MSLTRYRTTMIGLLSLALAATAPAAVGAAPATVLSTSSVGGETISCGCKKKDLGGLARRATLIRSERAETGATLLVDGGDWASNTEFEPWMRTEFQWKMMGELGYDAVTLGPTELSVGRSKLTNLFAGQTGIQVVSANITDKNDALLWADHAVIEKDGVRFGVTAVTDGAYYSFNLSRGTQESDDYAFRDMEAALDRVVPALRAKADVVVVLLHTSTANAQRMAERIDADVIVVGHNPGYVFSAKEVGGSLLVRGGNRGQYVSVVELDVTESGVTGKGRSVAMGEKVIEEESMKSVVEAFNSKYDDLAEKAGVELAEH